MFFWFAGGSLALMWNVFRDPAIDHRLVMVGAIAPDIIDGVTGGAWLFHTLLMSVTILFVVMAITIGHRQLRRQLLALPIGMFFHLLLDGAWAFTEVFWWPVQGAGFDSPLPVAGRSPAFNLVLELAGLAALIWAWRRFGLGDPDRRARFVRSGRVDRAITDGPPPKC
jgi:hypothetical protein